jgi:hypothetical protein
MRHPCSIGCKHRDTGFGGKFCSFTEDKRPCLKDPSLIPTQRQSKEAARKGLREFWESAE